MAQNQAEQTNGDIMPIDGNIDATKAKANKRLSVERIYQKKTQLEHILLRPDTYIGAVEAVTQPMWIYDDESGMVNRNITFVPGLYKIFDEILVNAADNKQRDSKMDCMKIDIDPENNCISVWNNGKGIPVVMHKDENMYVPSMIFGVLLTSSNYNDDQKKVTGGRNGFGAKLCNVFSHEFTVETACNKSGKKFRQTWTGNMSKAKDPKIIPHKGDDYTKITFKPDLSKFKMDVLDKDIVGLMSRRAYDIAGCLKGVKVILNGKRLQVKNFEDYCQQYIKGLEDDHGNPLKLVYCHAGLRWEVAFTVSDKGFQQVSFVNSIATTKGGRHVDHVAEQIVSRVADYVKKKNKAKINIKPFQIKNHMFVFVNCLIENPMFDSQTKENMTLQVKNFGSKCSMTDKFIDQILKGGVIDAVMTWANFKAQTQLDKKCRSTKASKIKGQVKLEDANMAGTQRSSECTLILTEGDSAKSLAVAGFAIVGRDRYGVFPLKGKLLNVREANHKQILENKEINALIEIIGLQYKKKYQTVEDLKSLRYGKVMIMADQDQDGSHIKGLLINFFHYNWPNLLKLPFLEEFITPIVKVNKKNESKSFYSLPEFQEWKTETPNWHTWTARYYKGLGTSTSKEAKEYFSDMIRHRIKFNYHGTDDDDAVKLAFSKKMVDQRKEWLTNSINERKRRRELGLPELYLYNKNTRAVTYSDFVNKELILFSNADNERSIPSLMDGLKPGQRKVIYTCIKRNDKRDVKVAQLAGSVAEFSSYHHGEQSLMGTIINLAQNFVGSNNVNLLQPNGQFGSRLQGGKDAASPRYISTMLSPLARMVFNENDMPLLRNLYDDNQKVEPEYYVPIVPMVLINGAEGIGTGWSTKIPNFNPREIISNIKRMLDGDDPVPMVPWYKHFKGSIEPLDNTRYVCSGEVAILNSTKIEITELPIKTWTQNYKESVMEVLLHGKPPKILPSISDYKDYNTDATVKYVVTMAEDKLSKLEEEGMHKAFKLQTTLNTSSMVLFDHSGCLRHYGNVIEILKEFFEVRLDYYGRRKEYLEGMLSAESKKLENQARFILEKISGKVVVENKKKKDIIRIMEERGYDSDPVKLWKDAIAKQQQQETENRESDSEEVEEQGSDFNYLLSMTMWSLTEEKKNELLKKRDDKLAELEVMKRTTPANMWRVDLDEFLLQLDEHEEKELKDLVLFDPPKASTKLKGKKKVMHHDVLPSPQAQRVQPKIDPELRKLAEKAAENKEAKGRKKKEDKTQKKLDDVFKSMENGDGKSLADRLGTTPDKIEKANKKQPKKKLKLTMDTSDEESDYMSENDWDDDSESDFGPSKSKKVAGATNGAARKVLESDDEIVISSANSDASFNLDSPKKAASKPKKAASKQTTLFDSLLSKNSNKESEKQDEAPKPKKGGGRKKKKDDDDDDDILSNKQAKKPKSKKNDSDKAEKIKKAPAKKIKLTIDTDDEDDDNLYDDSFETFQSAASRPKRAKAAKKMKLDSSEDEWGSDNDKETIGEKEPEPPVQAKNHLESDDEVAVTSNDSDDSFNFDKPVAKKSAPKEKKTLGPKATSINPKPSSLFDSLLSGSSNKESESNSQENAASDDMFVVEEVPKVQKKKAAPKKRANVSNDSDDDLPKPKKGGGRKKMKISDDEDDFFDAKPKKKTSKKSKNDDDFEPDDDGDDDAEYVPRQRAGGRARAPVKYKFEEDSNSNDDEDDDDF